MYCSECGAEIPNDAKFCPFCAKPVVTAQSQPHPQPYQPVYTPSQPYGGIPLKKSRSSSATGVLVLFVILFVITGILLFYFGFSTLSSSPTAGITMLIIAVVIICILCVVLSAKSGGGGGGGCPDCSGCDCDCGDCAS